MTAEVLGFFPKNAPSDVWPFFGPALVLASLGGTLSP